MASSLRIAAAISVLVVGLVVGTGAPAVASCAGSPSPSAYQFTGTVVSTGSEGRIAQVATDDGRKVEVRGTPDASGVTSVDRTYRQGARYEFHPVNNASPYDDNACTATRELSGPISTDGSAEVTTATRQDDTEAGLGLPILAGLTVLVLVAATAAVIGIVRRRRSTQRRLATARLMVLCS
jgi:hypothetical protein